MIFLQNSLPLANSSRTTSTMSSAWVSSLAKMSVFGTTSRPGNRSVKSLFLYSRMTVRIWSRTTTLRSSSLAVYSNVSSSWPQRNSRVALSR